METFSQVLKKMQLGVAPTPKRHTSWESGFLRHEDMPRAFPKHDVKHGVEETKRSCTPKRLGCVGIGIALRLGDVDPK
jgi:hypothetical protein